MHYCITLGRGIEAPDDIAEIIIPYDEIKDKSDVFEYIKQHSNQRIIIRINDLDAFEKRHDLKNFERFKAETADMDIPELDNWCLLFCEISANLKVQLIDAKIPYFTRCLVSDWESFDYWLHTDVTDIQISGDLAFDLKRTSKLAKAAKKKIRIFPNIAQDAADQGKINSFFVRPEDVSIYENYIDVIELYGSPSQQIVYYKIYNDDKQWRSQLSDIIYRLDSPIDNRCITEEFGARRIGCRKVCIKGGNCRFCFHQEELSKCLKEKDSFLRKSTAE